MSVARRRIAATASKMSATVMIPRRASTSA
jgi:hypothetical protein